MVHVPGLPGLIEVCAAAAGLIGAALGFIPKAEDLHRLLANLVRGFAVGGIAGTAIAFAIWIPIKLAA